MRHFDPIFNSVNVQIFTNADIGQEYKISTLSKCYDAVALCTGMSDSKRYWKDVPNCHGADEIFGWYNQNPKFKNLELDFSKVRSLVIIGNGNVALDMARIFARKHHLLNNHDMHPDVLKVLRNIDVKEITIIGRRGIENVHSQSRFNSYCV